MLKAMLHVIVPSLLFMGCTQTLPECKSDEDKQRGCAAREYHKNGLIIAFFKILMYKITHYFYRRAMC
ncbi:hypothetical protein NHP164001_09930 [Helicobacter trogontum]|uniref:Lipoprotein n=1 Tax=Helicobacter trogontum TaxID=50960 RepID=A0ABQ0D3S4_9HELI